MNIEVIRDNTKLNGTCYIELLPGPYKKKCWNSNSVFLEDDVFGLLEPTFEKHFPTFDHFAFQEISRDVWIAIISDLQSLSSGIKSAGTVENISPSLGCLIKQTNEDFNSQSTEHSLSLSRAIDELIEWLNTTLIDYETISVLGM